MSSLIVTSSELLRLSFLLLTHKDTDGSKMYYLPARIEPLVTLASSDYEQPFGAPTLITADSLFPSFASSTCFPGSMTALKGCGAARVM